MAPGGKPGQFFDQDTCGVRYRMDSMGVLWPVRQRAQSVQMVAVIFTAQ